MVDGSNVSAEGGPHWLLKIILTALISVIIGAVLRGNNPAIEFSRHVAGKVAERAVDAALLDKLPPPAPNIRPPQIQQGPVDASPFAAPKPLQIPSPQSIEPSILDPDERPQTVTSYVSLQIAEGAQYSLTAGTEYLLIAPLGFSVRYRMVAGYALQNRDGQFFRHCRSTTFTTHARVSVFSLVPCSQKAIVEVNYIVAGDVLADRPYARIPHEQWQN